MKRLIAIGAAALLFAPMTAQAQDWIYSKATDGDECYAMTIHGGVGLGFQGPSADGERNAGFMSFAQKGVMTGSGNVTVNFAVPGPLGGDHVATAEDSEQVFSIVLGWPEFSDFERLPDRFRVKIWRGSQVLIDTEVTGFRGAIANVRSCVAARG